MKKVIGVLIAAAMLTGTVVFADNAVINNDVAIMPIESVNAPVNGVMTVKEIGDGYILCEADMEIQLNISDDTVLIDSETMSAISLSDIKVNDKIQVEYSQAMTNSLPPQTTAYVIAVNFEKGGSVNYVNVDDVKTEEDGTVVVTDNTNNMILRILKDARTLPYRTKNIVKLADIQKGSKILAWFDIVTMSIPSQASTDKVVMLSSGDEETVSDELTVEVDGKVIETSDKPYYDEDTLMVPLRKISEALGYTVGWDAQTGAITVEDSYTQKATLFGGSNKIKFDGKLKVIDMDRELEIAKAAAIHDGCTFVPLEFFNEFMNETKLEGTKVTIAPSKAEIQ